MVNYQNCTQTREMSKGIRPKPPIVENFGKTPCRKIFRFLKRIFRVFGEKEGAIFYCEWDLGIDNFETVSES